MINEIWLPVIGYEGLYEASNLGRVKSVERWVSCHKTHRKLLKEKILVPTKQNTGYYSLPLYKDGIMKRRSLHRIIAEIFISNPNNYDCVDHIDGNRDNNKASNLR